MRWGLPRGEIMKPMTYYELIRSCLLAEAEKFPAPAALVKAILAILRKRKDEE